MKKTLLFLLFTFFLVTNLQAKIVNSLAIIVNNEPITQYEINQRMKEFGFDEYGAINSLVDERLKDAHLKQLNIKITNYDVDKKIEQISQEQGISIENIYKAMEKKGVNRQNYKKLVENQLKEEKLFTLLANQSDQEISQDDIIRFYEENIALYTAYDNVKAVLVFAPKAEILEDLRAGKQAKNFTQKEVNYKASDLNPRLNYIFANTPKNSLSPIMPTKNGFEMYYVIDKSGERTIPFEQISNQVANSYAQQKREEAFQAFFAKLRTKANIQFIKN